MAYQGDASGFLVGKQAANLLAKLSKNQEQTNELLLQMRRDTNTIQSTIQSEARTAAATARRATIRSASTGRTPSAATVNAAAAAAAIVVKRMKASKPAPRSTATVAREAVIAARATAGLPKRNAAGRFVGRAGSSSAGKPLSVAPAVAVTDDEALARSMNSRLDAAQAAKRAELQAKFDAQDERRAKFMSRFGGRIDAAKDALSSASEVDVNAQAAKEIANVASPVTSILFGSKESRAERRQEKRAEKRNKIIAKELTEIRRAIEGEGATGKKAGGKGIFGLLMTLLLPLITKIGGFLRNPLGALAGSAGGFFGGGRGGRIGRGLKGFARGALRRLGPLGLLLTAGDALANEASSDSEEAKRRNRYRIGGGAAGGAIGAVLGSILGPGGTLAGGLIGTIIGEKVGEWTKSMIDADIPQKIVNAILSMFNMVASSRPVQAAKSAASSAGSMIASVGQSLAQRIGRAESSGNYSADAQLKAFMESGGKRGSTATGMYQLTDGTFASVVSKSGNPVLADLKGLAATYLADKRGTFAKRRDPKYAALFASKFNPAVADASFNELTAANVARLKAAGISNPTDAQIYGTHVSGNTRFAAALSSNPNTPIGSVFGATQIARNRELFSGVSTVGDLVPRLNKRLGLPAMPSIAASPSAGSGTGGSGSAQVQVVPVPIPQIGQTVEDRNIAHAAAGGIGFGVLR